MMKRLGSSDSLGALIAEEQSPISKKKHMYGSSMLDGLMEEEDIVGGSHPMGEKKRRLSVDQVKALEKNFEVENKLEPERKVKLAQELGLQPRQVAVWFQNRRARWKTKQLERDYGLLKANYDNLKLNFDSLQQDNQALLKQIKDLKSRLEEEEGEQKSSEDVKEEIITTLQAEADAEAEAELIHHQTTSSDQELNYECFNDVVVGGASDSDTSAILNEDNNNAGISSPDLDHHHHQISSSCFQLQKTTTFHTHQYVKMEEHNFFTAADDACNFFSDEQPPTLQWCWT